MGAKLTRFGQDVTIHLEAITWRDPELICISGRTSSGDPCELLQHFSQVNLLLVRVPVPEDRPARRLGFKTAGEHAAEEGGA